MVERLKMADGPPSPDINPNTPQGSSPEQGSGIPQPSTLPGQQSTEQPGRVSKIGAWRSAEYDPKRTDYEVRKIDPVTGKKLDDLDYYIYFDPQTGKDVVRIPKMSGGAGAEAWLKDAAADKQSTFQDANEVVELASKFSAAELVQFTNQHPGFDTLLADSITILNETFRPQTEQEQRELDRVLYFVRDDIRRIYLDASQATVRTESDYYGYSTQTRGAEERLEVVDKALTNYEERFWDYGEATLKKIFGENADINALRQKYEGAASDLASKVAISIRKELKGLSLEPDAEFGDLYLIGIKSELEASKDDREKARREERKRATADERLHYNNYREKFDFTWAETPEELRDSVYDWLDYFQQQLPKEAEDKVYESVNTGLHNALASLEQARNRIGLAADSVIAEEFRETIEGHVATIGGVRLLESRDGFEHFIKLRADYAKNYIGHNDRIYLKKGSAIMADQLSENDGEIYKGGPEDINKPLPGDTKTFRGELERRAIHYATTHELYITEDDFERAELGEREIRQEIIRRNLSFEDGQAIIKQELEQRRAAGDRGNRYGWEDGIEELLLVDSRGMFKARSLTDPQEKAEAIAKVQARTGVFKKIKAMLDKEDDLFGKTPEERKEIIRQRIKVKITEEGNTVLLREIEHLPDQASKDRALWKWVENYNKPKLAFVRVGSEDEPWFPSFWDAERLSIDRPEGLVDRTLEKNEFKAMVEEIEDPYKGLTNEQLERQITHQFRVGIQRAVQAKNLPPDEAEKEFNRLMLARQEDIKRKIADVKFERQQRETRAIRNYNINKAQDKFLGLEARWGGLTTRKVNKEGKVELVTISSETRDILKAKIDYEEKEIEDKVDAWRVGFITANPNLTAEEIAEKIIYQRRLFRRNATFAATLALRELGIAHDLPIWNYYYYGDPALIGAFAPLVGYTDDDKGKVVELLEKGRREMEAVVNGRVVQYFEGQILVVRGEEGLKIEDEDGNQKDFHEELWVTPRVINEGGILKLRDLFEARFMISKSGGVKAQELVGRIADLGIDDELWENGCWDKREWQGFIKRRNKRELRQQSFLNTREWADNVTYVKRLGGAAAARRALVGGEIPGKGDVPGTLNEPFDGLWRLRGKFMNQGLWNEGSLRQIVAATRGNLPQYKKTVQEVLEKKGQIADLDPVLLDEMISTGGEILKYLIFYMNTRDYVRNRASYAPKNWQYDNELMAQAFIREFLKRKPVVARKGDILADGQRARGGELISEVGGEVLGDDHLAYAIQGRTRLGAALFEAIFRASSYHILDEADRRAVYGKAKVVKEKKDAKRIVLVNQILPQAARAGIDEERLKLDQQDQLERKLLEEFAKLAVEGKITPEQRVQYGQRLQTVSAQRRISEVNIARLTNQAIEGELNRQFNTGNFTNQTLRTMIAGRRQELADLGADPNLGNIELEINRVVNQYIEEELSKQFPGEWPVRVLE